MINEIEWKYVKPLNNGENIKNVESIYHIQVPQKLKEMIKKYNGGRPNKKIFDTEKSKERVMKCLLSYNKEDKENIYIYTEMFLKDVIPFANTEFGDVICIDNKSKDIKLYLHEKDFFEYICEDIETFFKRLY